MEEKINQSDLLGHVVRPPSLRASGSLNATLSGRFTPRNSPSFRRSQSSRTPRKDVKIYSSPLQWLRGQRLLPWLVMIGIWSYLGFHVQSKWAHSGANDSDPRFTAFESRAEVDDRDLRSHVSAEDQGFKKLDSIKDQVSVFPSNSSRNEQISKVFRKAESGLQSPPRLKNWFWKRNRGLEQEKLGNDMQQESNQTLVNNNQLLNSKSSSNYSITQVHNLKSAVESPPNRSSHENVVTESTRNTNDPESRDATSVEANNTMPMNMISLTEHTGVKVKRNTSFGLLVGPFDKTENKVLGWNAGKRYSTCNRKGLFANTVRGRSFIVVLHELSMTGAPLVMMELAAEILSCGGRVSAVALSRKGGLMEELNRRGIKLLKDKSVQSYRAAMKSDIVIAGSAVSALWIEQYLLHYKKSSDRLIWWIMENRREYFDRSKNLLHKVKALMFLSELQSQQWLTWCAEEGIKLPPTVEVVPLSVNDELAFVAGLQTALNSPLFSIERMLEKRKALREEVRRSMGLDSNDMLVMTLSSINPGKGQLMLLKAALMIADENFIPKMNPEHAESMEASRNALGGVDMIVEGKGISRVLSEFPNSTKGGGSHSHKTIAVGTTWNQATAHNSTLADLMYSSHTGILDRGRQLRKLLADLERNRNQTLKLLIGSVGSKSNKVLYVKSMLGLTAHQPKLARLMLWTPATIHVAPLYAAADVYVINAQGIGETFGRVTIEAMAFGLPAKAKGEGEGRRMGEEVVKDLKIKVEAPFAVYPAEAKATRSLFLSNIDQTLVAPVGTLSFFSATSYTSFEEVVESYVKALREMLVTYDFMGGRLKLKEEEDRVEIECNGAGALFAVASSELTMEELGDITTPNLAFKNLVLHDYVALSHHHDLPLFTLQATRFKCGSFAVGAALNHCILDGISCFHMMINLASIARGKGVSVTPFVDRTLLRARVPPKIDYDHLEYSKISDLPPHNFTPNFSGRGVSAGGTSDMPSSVNVLKLFPLSGQTLDRLKEKGKEEGRKCTSFEVVTALVWKVRTAAVAEVEEMKSDEEMWTVLFPVDLRSKMEPPLPREYAGNAVIPGYARASAKELKEESVWALVLKVQQGLRRINNEYARSVVDWLEVNKGIPCAVRSFSVVAWWRLGMDEVEFPWGMPLHFGPVIFSHSQELVMLLPHHTNHGLNIAIALPPHQMPVFEQLLQLFVNSC